MEALAFVLEHEHRRGQWLSAKTLDLSFASDSWRRLVIVKKDGTAGVVRQQLEICIFTYLATELKTGDVCVVGSESYADFGEQLLSWQECQPQLKSFCQELGIPSEPDEFIAHLTTWLTQTAVEVDQICKDGTQVTFSQNGEPVLKRIQALPQPLGARELEALIHQRLPERSILDILANVEHWLHWTRHFGPESGSEPKLDDPLERYILTVFGLGCNLGPNQTARHTKGRVTSHQLS